jgi:peptidoglycan/LPS O-acetylase OafA/YrhL
MLRSLNRPNIVAAWVGVLLAVAGAAALSGVSITPGDSALWFAVCVVPPVVMLMVWSGAPSPAMQEILYAGDRRD